MFLGQIGRRARGATFTRLWLRQGVNEGSGVVRTGAKVQLYPRCASFASAANSEKTKTPFYQSAGFWISWFVGGISAYFYRSSTSGEREDKVLKGILAKKAVSRNETREIRSGNYEFTVNEYNKLCKTAFDCFGTTEPDGTPKRITLREFEKFLQLSLGHLTPNFGDVTKNMDFNEKRGMYYKGEYPIGNYFMLERVFQTLEQNAKLEEGYTDGTVSLYYLLIALSLAISPAESLVARMMGLFDATVMFTDNNLIPEFGKHIHVTNIAELEEAVKQVGLNANNLPELFRAMILTNQIPARRLIRTSKKWPIPEYEMVSPVTLTRMLLLDTTDEKMLEQWPLQPPIRVPIGYGDEEPKTFLPGMADEVQRYMSDDEKKNVEPKRKYPYFPQVVGTPPLLDSERTINFDEFSCMLRTKKCCAWNSCRTMQASSKANKNPDIGKEVNEKQRLMEIMAGIEVEFEPSPSFGGARDGFIFKNGEKGLGYYTDVYQTALKRQREEKEKK